MGHRSALNLCREVKVNKVEELTDGAVRETIERLGYEIVDIEFVKTRGSHALTIYIDIPRGVSLDDCELVHNAIDPLIDAADPFDGPYTLNVSSPGLDRPFKKQRDYERNYGKEVEIKLYAPYKGKKVYEGVLKEKTEHTVVFSDFGGETVAIEDTRIAYVRPLVRFE